MTADHGDACGLLARLVIGRPIDRAALQHAKPRSIMREDDRRARQRPVRAGSAMCDLELIETRDRRHNRRLAIVDIVGKPHCMNAG